LVFVVEQQLRGAWKSASAGIGTSLAGSQAGLVDMTARWCDHADGDQLAVVGADPAGDEAELCRWHWYDALEASRGLILAIHLAKDQGP
jgi:hypothetical protein